LYWQTQTTKIFTKAHQLYRWIACNIEYTPILGDGEVAEAARQ